MTGAVVGGGGVGSPIPGMVRITAAKVVAMVTSAIPLGVTPSLPMPPMGSNRGRQALAMAPLMVSIPAATGITTIRIIIRDCGAVIIRLMRTHSILTLG